MRLEMRRDCTAEPPGELTMMATAGAGDGEGALRTADATDFDIEPAGPLLGGDDAMQAHHRNRAGRSCPICRFSQDLSPIAPSRLRTSRAHVCAQPCDYQMSRLEPAEDGIELGAEGPPLGARAAHGRRAA